MCVCACVCVCARRASVQLVCEGMHVRNCAHNAHHLIRLEYEALAEGIRIDGASILAYPLVTLLGSQVGMGAVDGANARPVMALLFRFAYG